ncbi:MAG: hypothetical protein DRN27_10280 [Thermoplasmata archaeon]|nr:MAG: hypothetical protein DRN27_10280 [Thermoplasmata archaeon]
MNKSTINEDSLKELSSILELTEDLEKTLTESVLKCESLNEQLNILFTEKQRLIDIISGLIPVSTWVKIQDYVVSVIPVPNSVWGKTLTIIPFEHFNKMQGER